MERNIEFAVGEYYHVYSRGIDKGLIFKDQNDYYRFVKLLYLLNNTDPVNVFKESRGKRYGEIFYNKRGEPLVGVGAYCLMPNHVHLILREISEGGISAFARKLFTSHSMIFNKKYKRVGPLFQSRFKARHIDNDDYLRYLFAYVHLNPIKLFKSDWKENGTGDEKEANNFLDTYSFSSYLDFIGKKRPSGNILNSKDFPGYFENQKEFKDFLSDWLTFGEEFAQAEFKDSNRGGENVLGRT
ncbi:MAG TPA: transposase [Candidatus Paceibacterota bacterium]|nr:transposase [Candidatus Paceibacterota bacterium]HQI26243.1 transposase [Candidatus Paceibacterota bacterium]